MAHDYDPPGGQNLKNCLVESSPKLVASRESHMTSPRSTEFEENHLQLLCNMGFHLLFWTKPCWSKTHRMGLSENHVSLHAFIAIFGIGAYPIVGRWFIPSTNSIEQWLVTRGYPSYMRDSNHIGDSTHYDIEFLQYCGGLLLPYWDIFMIPWWYIGNYGSIIGDYSCRDSTQAMFDDTGG